MRQPFGSIFNLTLAPARFWLSLGPGWTMIAGALSTRAAGIEWAGLMQLLTLWLLVDPILGMLWELSTQHRLWRRMVPAQLPPPPGRGFFLPYAQPDSLAGRLARWVRRYRLWWGENFQPEMGSQLIAFGLGAGLSLLISLPLGMPLFRLTVLALALIILAGFTQTDLAAPEGGCLQSVIQVLLPWVMGALLWSTLTPLSLALAICYWVTYLGGLRVLGGHQRAEPLYFLGQIAAIALLLGLRLLPGAALLAVLLVTQWIIKTKLSHSPDFLTKAQPYVVFSLLIAGWSLGSL